MRQHPVGHAVAVIAMMAVGFAVLLLALRAHMANMTMMLDGLSPRGWTLLAIGSSALLTLPWYRSRPLVLIVVGAVCAAIVGTDPYVLSIGLTVWIGRAHKPWQWWVVAVAGAAFAVNAVGTVTGILQWWDFGAQPLALVLAAALYFLGAGLTVGIGLWSRQRHRLALAEAEARAARHDNVQLSGELARQREREELAREVHDTLASRLSAIALQAGSLEDLASEAGNHELDEAMHRVRANATNALGDLRSLLTSLRAGGAPAAAPHLTPTGLSDVHDLIEDAAAAGLEVSPSLSVTDFDQAPDALRRAVVRITQEALTNALRYSADRAVTMDLRGAAGAGLRLAFENRYDDAGVRFDAGAGTGLRGVRERAQLLGGQMHTHRADGTFALVVDLPWPT